MSNKTEESYWDKFYSSWQEPVPSQFAALVAGFNPDSESIILDFGCGNGRDSIFFNKYGYRVFASDRSKVAISKLKEVLTHSNSSIDLSVLDFGNKSELDDYLKQHIRSEQSRCIFYARFLLHAFDSKVLEIFLTSLKSATRKNDILAFEFRTKTDDRLSGKATEAHFRQGLEIHQVLKYFQEANFDVLMAIEGFGFAVYKSDNAHVARIIIQVN